MARCKVVLADVKRCANCQTERYLLRARQLCGRCYYAQRRLEQADEVIDEGIVEAYKAECQRRLDVLKIMERKRTDPISGPDLENRLAWLAKKAGVRKNIFHGLATYISQHFGPEQRTVLYGLLSDIQENIQWAGVD